MAAKKQSVVTVRKIGDCWGIGDGKLWFFYSYKTEQQAQAAFDNADGFKDPEVRRVNISREQPVQVVK